MSTEQQQPCTFYLPCRNNQYKCDNVAGFATKEQACNAYNLNPQGYAFTQCGQQCNSCDSSKKAICDAPEQKGKTPGWGSFGGREAIMNLSTGGVPLWKKIGLIIFTVYILLMCLGWLMLIVKAFPSAPGLQKLLVVIAAPFYYFFKSSFRVL